jgi:site-specific recombinase XerC
METTNSTSAIWAMLTERWGKAIRAQNRSGHTLRGYLYSARRWIGWLESQRLDLEPDGVRPHHIDDFIVDIIDERSAGNASHHYRNLRVFFAWLVRRKEISSGVSPFEGTEQPSVNEKITPLLSDEDHAAILLACEGKDLLCRRDKVIVLLFIDTGMRVSELHSIQVDGIDLKTKTIEIRGKGGKVRWVRFGNSTGLALARYLKVRGQHPLAESSGALWLSARKHIPLTVDGIKRALRKRGRQAGVVGNLHAHRFRHDFSDRWKAAGGTEESLMVIAGWSSTKMPRHYGKQAQARRALAEHDRISPVDSLVV